MMLVQEGKKYLKEISEIINKVGYKEWLANGRSIENPSELENPAVKYYIFKKDGETAGFCAFKKEDNDISVADVAILEKFRGKIGKYFSILGIKKYISENDCKMMVARIDKCNKKSLFFTTWIGFKKYFEDKKYIYVRLNLWEV